MTGWKKCPSVMTGGKPHFYKKGELTVVWDRMSKNWCLENRLMVIERFPSATAAMKSPLTRV
jgi:hypothetical protein